MGLDPTLNPDYISLIISAASLNSINKRKCIGVCTYAERRYGYAIADAYEHGLSSNT